MNKNHLTRRDEPITEHLFSTKTLSNPFIVRGIPILFAPLVDDRAKNGAGEFKGELIRFGSDKFPDWAVAKKYLMDKK